MKPITVLGREKKDGSKPVYVQVIIMRERVQINTKISVQPNIWDEKRGLIKGKSSEVYDNNLIIGQCKSRVTQILVKYRLNNKEITPALFLKEYSHPSYDVDFLAWMEAEIKILTKQVGPRRIIKYTTILNKIKEFRNPLTFSEIDHFFIQDFRAWCKTTKNNELNTISGNLAVLKTFTTRAKRKNLIEIDPFVDITIGRGKPNRTFCTDDEIKILLKMYEGDPERPLKPHLIPVLRHFLFMLLTGLRISDFTDMTFDNIANGSLRLYPIKTRSKKKEMVKIPLSRMAIQLIKDEGNLTGRLFNPCTEQRMNANLKTIALAAGIKKQITNHTARHTFATFFIQKTADVATLQRLLGHSRIEETMVYVHITEKNLFDQMKKFEDAIDLLPVLDTNKNPPALTPGDSN